MPPDRQLTPLRIEAVHVALICAVGERMFEESKKCLGIQSSRHQRRGMAQKTVPGERDAAAFLRYRQAKYPSGLVRLSHGGPTSGLV